MAKATKQEKEHTIQGGPNAGLGWLPDRPDHRDIPFSANIGILKSLPSKVDLRASCPPVYDQGQLGSCTANALGAAFQFCKMKQKSKSAFMPSRLFIYYNERVLINTVASDSGAFLRDGIKTLNKDGVCPESEWPYSDDHTSANAPFKKKPTAKCYSDALKAQVLSYQKLDNSLILQLKGCLCEGFPFVFGFSVYQSFYNIGANGMMPIPKPTENLVGGHAVMAVGFDDAKQAFIIRNSWGPAWAMNGYFYMPYSYITSTKYAKDFWTIRLVEESAAAPAQNATPAKKKSIS